MVANIFTSLSFTRSRMKDVNGSRARNSSFHTTRSFTKSCTTRGNIAAVSYAPRQISNPEFVFEPSECQVMLDSEVTHALGCRGATVRHHLLHLALHQLDDCGRGAGTPTGVLPKVSQVLLTECEPLYAAPSMLR